MATQQMICASSSSSSSSSSSLVSLKKYDVFLSFRGEDTRRNFTSHLYNALRKKVKTFIDDNELQKGGDISPALIEAIEESYISLVVFSEDYASSKWCLNELVKILECKNGWGQIVIPVFYNIDPSHVRKQTESYQRAFEKHKRDRKLNKQMLQKWKDALFEASNLVGFDTRKYRNESDVIQLIVEDILQQLKHRYPYEVKDKGLVRIKEKCEEMESILEIGSNDVRSLGVWGMGGIGKTTLVENLIAKLYSQFEGYCFLKNVREESQKYGLDAVRNRLFSNLLEEENLRLDAPCVETQSIMRRLLRKKLLIVLDDVATLKQMECLMIDNNCLGSGSRVIVTTRDKQIIRHVHETYEVKEWNERDSIELFCLNAFKEKHPKIGYEELSKSAISYCKGNPLALKVLGARLGSRSKIAWESDLQKLQEIPDLDIHNVLKLSYDDLDHTQKNIFLDIACFFVGKESGWVTSLLDACGFFATVGMEVLIDKALITINSQRQSIIEMHDLIQELGQEVVKQEALKNPGERSRLWKLEEVVDVLKNNKGTEVVEGIGLLSSHIAEDLYLSYDSFERMTNLRYLSVSSMYANYCIVDITNGLRWLSDKLRYFKWDAFPLKSLPSTFCAEMLVELHMEDSKLKKLPSGIQNARHLKKINLSCSKDLIEMPDLSRAVNLESICLFRCESLRELHPSILSLPKLEELDLNRCTKIESVKSNTHSKSLRRLDLTHCSSLVEISVTSEEMTSLQLECTALRELPSSIWRNRKLCSLGLYECYELNIVGKKLSNDPRLRYLTILNLHSCRKIDALNLSLLLDGIQSLKKLYLYDCSNLESLPHNIHKQTKLEYLELDYCMKLVLSSITQKLPPYLRCLSAFNCTPMDTDTTQRLLFEKNLLQIQLQNRTLQDRKFKYYTSWLIPGDHDHVLGMFGFQNAGEASITIPPIPKSNLRAFLFCILLSNGLHIIRSFSLKCYIYEHGKRVDIALIHMENGHMILFSDHVFLCLFECDIEESEGDHYNLSFDFEHCNYEADEWSTECIVGCGVHPVYALEPMLELDDKSSSGVEIVELESTVQVCDVDELQARVIAGDVGGSSNQNEDDQQQLSFYTKEEEKDFNAKSSCDCSIGLLLKYLLERSTDTIIQVTNVLSSIFSRV